jgi:hypothetical protein
MIRSNPTAIPLRASDLKHLQATVEQRKKAASNANPTDPSRATTTDQPQDRPDARGEAAATATSLGSAQGQGHNTVEKRRKERAGMTVNERIGL